MVRRLTIKLTDVLVVVLFLSIYTYILMVYFAPWLSGQRYWMTLDSIHFKQAADVSINMTDYRQTPLSPGLQWCASNPFLAKYDRKTVFYMEHIWYNWSKSQFQNVYNVLTKLALSPENSTGYITRMAYPDSFHLPCPHKGGLVRYGRSLGTGKVLCGMATIASTSKCIVYSLGSNNNFEFEDALTYHTSCEVHTYDCTSDPPAKPMKDVKFHKICMGEKTNLQQFLYPYAGQKQISNNKNDTFKRVSQIMKDNNHTYVHLLKMDIEGGEYAVFADLFDSSTDIHLPFQISFESHWWNRDFYHATLHQQMFYQFWRKGYRFLYHELNPGDHSCVEWTLMRVFC